MPDVISELYQEAEHAEQEAVKLRGVADRACQDAHEAEQQAFLAWSRYTTALEEKHPMFKQVIRNQEE